MWALRRAANPLWSQGCCVGTLQACCTKFIVQSDFIENAVGVTEPTEMVSGECLFSKRLYHSPSIHMHPGSHSLSSQAGAESSADEEDLEDEFSELEKPTSMDSIEKSNTVEEIEELAFGPEISDVDSEESLAETSLNELDLSDSEAHVTDEELEKKKSPLDFFRAIMNATHVENALDKWVAEGNHLGRSEISVAMLNLRKRRMYGKALQVSEWFEKDKQLNFVERDYASRLDLIARLRGLEKAEKYMEKIPESFRGEIIHRTLLASCVAASNVKKAEEVFNKMKELDFPINTFACNQLIQLYKRFDKKKIADILLLMEKENVKPTLFTYRLLIDTKGQSNDITGMEQVLESMKAEGIKPDILTQSLLSKHYMSGGLNEKAEAVLKEMEAGCSFKESRAACRNLLPLFAALGKADDVKRVWKACESNPQLEECVAAIEAWGKLGKIEEAEAVFEKMCETWKKLPSKNYTALLKVYADHKLLSKGKDLAKRMADSGCRIGPLIWDGLVKLYVEAGEVEKADSILQKAVQQSSMKPFFNSYMVIMDEYANRGDVHNAEKMFHRLKQAGYVGFRQFQTLLKAYIKAKSPAYGLRDRMRADKIFPNKAMAAQLVQVDAFRKTAVSDLLD